MSKRSKKAPRLDQKKDSTIDIVFDARDIQELATLAKRLEIEDTQSYKKLHIVDTEEQDEVLYRLCLNYIHCNFKRSIH